jgi:putative ABC transport system substrate-binding protein
MTKLLPIIVVLVLVLGGGYYFFSQQKSSTTNNTQQAQSGSKKYTVGVISFKSSKGHEDLLAAMKAEMAKRGYADVTYLQDDIKENTEMPALAKKYVDQKVDVIIGNTTAAVKAAMKETKDIPIVFGGLGDPVLNGVVNSLDASGNNVTGINNLSIDITPDRLTYLRTLKPTLKKVYFITQQGDVPSENSKQKALRQAQALGLTLVERNASSAAEAKALGAKLKASEADAIMLAANTLIAQNLSVFVEAQNREKLPLIGNDSTMADRGAALSYGADYAGIGVQTAAILDQIFKGKKPTEIPIPRAEKVDLVLNAKAISGIGLTIPADLKAKASKVTE